jgi:hypothetical protein
MLVRAIVGRFFEIRNSNDGVCCLVEAKSSASVQTSFTSTTYGPDMYRSTAVENENTMTTDTSVQEAPSLFVPRPCSNLTRMGAYCNISATPCDLLQPCQNNGTCNNTDTALSGYACACPQGVNGTLCELDYRPCQPHTCWNNGECECLSQFLTFSCLHMF